jgi:excisionase family DNA binding protein
MGANDPMMSPSTRQDPSHQGGRSRYGPTPAEPDGADQPALANEADQEAQRWRPADGDHPPPPPGAPVDPTGTLTATFAGLPQVLTAREAAGILRVGRNQLYQAVARGQVPAVRIGRTIRIPKHALLHLLTPTKPPKEAGGGE